MRCCVIYQQGEKDICCNIFLQVTNGNITQYFLFISLFLALCMQYTLNIPPFFWSYGTCILFLICIEGNSVDIYVHVYAIHSVPNFKCYKSIPTVNVIYFLILRHFIFI